MSFIGLGLKICPFPQFSLQAQCIAAVLSERKNLPSEELMNADEEKDYREKLSSCLLEKPGAPNENIVQNHLNIALLNVL